MNVFNQGRKLQELRTEFDHSKDFFARGHNELVDRVNELEKALVETQAAHSEELKEIRERLDMPQRRKSTVRPWNMLRSVAEAGERFMKEKTSA